MTEWAATLDNYSIQELAEAFESIDDKAYPDRANTLYTLLLRRSNKSPQQLTADYDNGPMLDAIGAVPLISTMAADWQLSNRQITEKIARITARQRRVQE